MIGSHFTSHSNTKIYRYNPWFRAELCLGSIAASIKILTLSRRVRRTWPLSKTFIFNYICRTLADLTCSLDLFFLCFLGSIRVLKPKNESFCALSEPSVRFRISELRFGNYLTRKMSLVRVQSCHCFQWFIFPYPIRPTQCSAQNQSNSGRLSQAEDCIEHQLLSGHEFIVVGLRIEI